MSFAPSSRIDWLQWRLAAAAHDPLPRRRNHPQTRQSRVISPANTEFLRPEKWFATEQRSLLMLAQPLLTRQITRRWPNLRRSPRSRATGWAWQGHQHSMNLAQRLVALQEKCHGNIIEPDDSPYFRGTVVRLQALIFSAATGVLIPQRSPRRAQCFDNACPVSAINEHSSLPWILRLTVSTNQLNGAAW